MRIQFVLLFLSAIATLLSSVVLCSSTAQRWKSSIGTVDTTISPTDIGFIGNYATTDANNNKIEYLVAADYRSDVIRAVRSDTGATVYTVNSFGPGLGRSVVVSQTQGVDFAVVTTHWGSKLQAFRASNGAPIWSKNMSQNISCSPSIAGNILAVRANDTVYAGTISANTNPSGVSLIWDLVTFTMNTSGVIDNEIGPLLYDDNKYIFVMDSLQYIYGINIATQTAEWAHPHPTLIASPNAIWFPDLKRIMFLGRDGKLHSHDSDTGMTAWKLPTQTTSNCSSALFYDSTRKALFFGCEDARIVCVVNLTAAVPGGDILFSTTYNPSTSRILAGTVYSNADSTLYFGDDSGRLAKVQFNIAPTADFPTGANQQFTWTWDSSLPASIPATAPFTLVPILTSAVDSSSTTTPTPIAVLGNQRQIYAYSVSNNNNNPASPPSSTIIWIPLQFDVNIVTPTAYFSPDAFIANIFTTVGLNQASTVYKILKELPIGGPTYRVVLEFESQSVANRFQSMSAAQMQALSIMSISTPTASPSAAPILSREVPGPLGVAIGVTCGIVAIFLALFALGIFRSSKEPTPEELALAKYKAEGSRATVHTEFSFKSSGAGLDDVQAVTINGDSFEQQQFGGHQQQQQQYQQQQQQPQQRTQRTYSVTDDLLGSISGMPDHLRQQLHQQASGGNIQQQDNNFDDL